LKSLNEFFKTQLNEEKFYNKNSQNQTKLLYQKKSRKLNFKKMYFEQKLQIMMENQAKLLQMIEESRMRPEQPLKVYTLNQVAEIFNVTVRTIYNWKEQGILPCTIIGSKTYVTEAQLQKFLTEHEVKPAMRGRAW